MTAEFAVQPEARTTAGAVRGRWEDGLAAVVGDGAEHQLDDLKVGRDDVRAQCAFVLCARDQLLEHRDDAVTHLRLPLRAIAGAEHDFAQASVVAEHRACGLDDALAVEFGVLTQPGLVRGQEDFSS